MLGDLAVLTGGTAIFKDLGIQLDSVKLSDLGKAKKVIDRRPRTRRSSAAAGKKEAIDGRAEQIRREIEVTDSDYDREKLQERLAKLAGGVAQINVGAATETEMKERKALLEDAKAATQGRAGRRHRARRRRGPDPRPRRRSTSSTSTGDEKLGAEDRSQRARLPAACDRRERRRRRRGRRQSRPADEGQERRLRRRQGRATATWSPPASSIRPRSSAPRCKTRPASPRLLLTTESLDHRDSQGRRRSRRPRPPRPRHGWHGRNGRRHGWHGWHGMAWAA